jgi:hypothetical protein
MAPAQSAVKADRDKKVRSLLGECESFAAAKLGRAHTMQLSAQLSPNASRMNATRRSSMTSSRKSVDYHYCHRPPLPLGKTSSTGSAPNSGTSPPACDAMTRPRAARRRRMPPAKSSLRVSCGSLPSSYSTRRQCKREITRARAAYGL